MGICRSYHHCPDSCASHKDFVVQAFKIPSGSMIPTLLIGDHILVNKFLYGTQIPFTDKKILIFREPGRGTS